MPTKDEARAIHHRIEEVLRAEFGDKVKLTGGNYNEARVMAKVEIVLGDATAQTDHLRQQFAVVGYFLGLVETDFDLPLTVRGTPCKLADVKSRAGRFPFVVQTEDGKRWKVGPDIFLAARARAASLHSSARERAAG